MGKKKRKKKKKKNKTHTQLIKNSSSFDIIKLKKPFFFSIFFFFGKKRDHWSNPADDTRAGLRPGPLSPRRPPLLPPPPLLLRALRAPRRRCRARLRSRGDFPIFVPAIQRHGQVMHHPNTRNCCCDAA